MQYTIRDENSTKGSRRKPKMRLQVHRIIPVFFPYRCHLRSVN